MTGIVKRYDDKKGFGFLMPLIGKPDTVKDVFFHISQVQRDANGVIPKIPQGAEVSFDLVRAEKGVQATNVRIRRISSKALLQHAAEESAAR